MQNWNSNDAGVEKVCYSKTIECIVSIAKSEEWSWRPVFNE
jgi:hypothetical protein